ncbi:Palmitoyltransferase PFA3 [Grifola frondosa]|uniref:Palmitoyltransferase n=1 Tax=Grifola frondosa TaxID=5627 RepID=A0A1C7M2R0_GRIFR|nr:Palmitoyltransferase PFA3 [Grifola frondosa]
MPRDGPLISLPSLPPRRMNHYDDDDEDSDPQQKRWYRYLPLCCAFPPQIRCTLNSVAHVLRCRAVFLMLAPHPSLLIMFVNYYYRTLHAPVRAVFHLFAIYTLTFLAFSSLIVVVARDPGPVTAEKTQEAAASDREDESFLEALLAPDDEQERTPLNWCRRCSAPKPERAHHCSTCGRCVLKMDHHCVWLGSKCIGHRTHAAFVHFLFCITALAMYIAILCISAVYYAFTNPLSIDETTPLHEMFLAFYGVVISMVIGSFLGYHIYLITTNQTTLESLSPFLLLRYLPPLPPSPEQPKLSNPPLEHELSLEQRWVVRDAHHHIRLYDVGWRKNWGQVFGWTRPWGWVRRITVGGGCVGDGRSFPRNPRADQMLARLAARLVDADKTR